MILYVLIEKYVQQNNYEKKSMKHAKNKKNDNDEIRTRAVWDQWFTGPPH